MYANFDMLVNNNIKIASKSRNVILSKHNKYEIIRKAYLC